MRPKHFVASLIVFVLPIACGGAPTAQSPSSDTTASDSDDWGQEEPPGGLEGSGDTKTSCFPKCAELLGKAGDLFDFAQNLDSGPGRTTAFQRSGEAYVHAWRGCSLEATGGEDLHCDGASLVLPRMIKSFEESGREDHLIHAWLIARDRRWQSETSPEDAVLSTAAEHAEKRGRQKPPEASSKNALRMASYARISLKQGSLAERNLADYRKLADKSDQEETTLLSIALAAAFNDWGKHADAQRTLGRLPSNPSERLSILWNAESGRASAGLNRTQAASQSFDKVIGEWSSLPQNDLRRILGPAEPWPIPDRERMVEAVGAAHFFRAEQLRLQADRLPFPKYTGPATTQGAFDFINEKVGPYIRDRQKRLIEADDAYGRIAEIKPVPPTRWVIASASRMGRMWASFAQDVTTAPAPPHLAKDEELLEGYRQTLRESMKPVQEKARRAFEVCNEAALRARLRDEFTQECEKGLGER